MIVLWSVAAAASPLVAVVVLDQEAREEGYALELEDLVVEDALPVDVAEGEEVRIVDPDGGRHALDVAAGEAWTIAGPGGEAWMSRIGEEVRTDVLGVRGDARSVRALADALGARIVVDDAQTWLVGDDILFDAPWVALDGTDALDDVRFATVDDPSARRAATSRITPRAPRPSAPVPAVITPVPVAGTSAPPPHADRPARRSQPIQATAPFAPTETTEPVAVPSPVAAPHRDARLDPDAYVGVWLCGDGTPLLLDPSGVFAHPNVAGEWYVAAPGVVRLAVDGVPFGRAAFELDRRYCRAVW